jgi:hypothetical protein
MLEKEREAEYKNTGRQDSSPKKNQLSPLNCLDLTSKISLTIQNDF